MENHGGNVTNQVGTLTGNGPHPIPHRHCRPDAQVAARPTPGTRGPMPQPTWYTGSNASWKRRHTQSCATSGMSASLTRGPGAPAPLLLLPQACCCCCCCCCCWRARAGGSRARASPGSDARGQDWAAKRPKALKWKTNPGAAAFAHLHCPEGGFQGLAIPGSWGWWLGLGWGGVGQGWPEARSHARLLLTALPPSSQPLRRWKNGHPAQRTTGVESAN